MFGAELVIVLLAMYLGARLGGIGIGFAGGLGVLVLTLIFQIKPGAIPFDVIEIIMAVIAAIAAMMGCAPEQVRILSLREDSPWRPTLLISDGGQIDEKIPDKNKWKNL